MVHKDHIDALVTLAISGPCDNAGPGGGYGYGPPVWNGPRWALHDPRETRWQDQTWLKLSSGGRADFICRREEVDADHVGSTLWAANARSLAARYPDDWETMLPDGFGPYVFERGERVSGVVGLKLIDCLDYQSCEFPEWPDTEAWRFLDSLKDCLIGSLAGYHDAPWEYRRPGVGAA